MNVNHNAIHILTSTGVNECATGLTPVLKKVSYWRQVMRIHPPTAAELFKILKAINCLMFYFARTAIIDSVIYLLPQPRSF